MSGTPTTPGQAEVGSADGRPGEPSTAELSTATAGLTTTEAAGRLRDDGPNDLLVTRTTGPVAAVWHQLVDTVIVVLLVAGLLTTLVGDLASTAIILAVVVLNTTLGAVQEIRSGRAVAALATLTSPKATVVRDGAAATVDSRSVVRGDRLRLVAGDIAAADARVELTESFEVDESTLTGESVPVSKRPGQLLYAGTVVTRGRADAVVEATGMASAIGRIAHSVATGAARTPLQVQLATLGRRVTVVASIAAVVIGVLNILLGATVEASVVIAISLAVAAIPESLPAVVSLSMAMSARRLAAGGVLARRLTAVEALGSVTILASDKTGTLTAGRMSVTQQWEAGVREPNLPSLLEAAALCSDAYAGGVGLAGPQDDPTEIALIDAAVAAGTDLGELRGTYRRIGEVPFDAVAARMTTRHRDEHGREFEVRKGAPERLLPGMTCETTAIEVAQAWAALGRRVLAVLIRPHGGDWTVLGLIALADPARATASTTIAAFRRAGVRPVMITGDHPDTAAAIAAAVGISAPGDRVGSAADCLAGSDHSVYARVLPEDKTSIVEELRRRGHVVAMTGDGVNDAPALRAADIGVAMGLRGTEVAKQSADLVLVNDDLSVMVPAIAEGRRTYDNLRRFLHYALSGGVAEVLVMLIGPFVGFAVPLTAGQILWVNLLTHGPPGVAMGGEPADPNVLTRAPRRPGEQLLDRATALRVGGLGATIAATTLGIALFADAAGRPWQSMVFVSLSAGQLAVALALRPSGAGRRNVLLPAAVALSVALTVLAVTWPPLRSLLQLDPLTWQDLSVCVVGAVIPAVLARVQVMVLPRRRDRSRRRRSQV